MARQKEIMADIDFYGNPIKKILVKIPTHCTKDQTDIENLEFSIMDLVVMDKDLSVILKDIFNLGIVLQTFRTTEKVWRDVSPDTRIALPEWSHVKVKLFNNDPETDNRSEELVIRRSKLKTRDPRIKSLPDSKFHSLLNLDRRDPRRRDDFDVSIPVDNAEEQDSYTMNPEAEIRTVSPVQERDPRRKLAHKRDPRQRDPRKSSSQEKDSGRSSTEDRKSPSEERDPRKRFCPAVQLPVITPEKVELPENRLQPLSSFPQKPNKPISKVMPMVMQTDHKDPRRRKRVPEMIPDPPHFPPDPGSDPHCGVSNPQQGESVPKPSVKMSEVQMSGMDSDSDDGELKIDIKETEEDTQDNGDFSKSALDTNNVAVSKTELLKKLLPHKFGDIKTDEKDLKEGDVDIYMSEKQTNQEGDKKELARKNPVLDDPKKTSGLDDSFGLWDEVYGVTENVDVATKKVEVPIKNDTVVTESVVNAAAVKADSVPPTNKLGVNLKEFAKNMVRNTLMRPSKNSPKTNEVTKSSQEPVEEKGANEEVLKDVIIDKVKEQCADNQNNPVNNIDKDEEIVKKSDVNPPLNEVKDASKERDDEQMKQLEISRDDCRKKIEDLERERRELQQRELLLSLEKERDRLNKSLEMEDAAQALADELEDGEITDSDDDEKCEEGEGNTSIESPKALEIDENSLSPSPPEDSSIYVTIRHDTPQAVVRRKPPKLQKKGRNNLHPTKVPKNPLMREERLSEDDVVIVSDTTQDGKKSKKKRSESEELGEKSKIYRSDKGKVDVEKRDDGSSDQSGEEFEVKHDLGKMREGKSDEIMYPDRRGESISEDDCELKVRRKSGEQGNKERYPKYWEEFEQQIKTKKKPKQKHKSWSEDEDAVKGAFDEDTVWINNQERSQHWTRKSVQSIVSGSSKKFKTAHKPNLDLEVLQIPQDTGGEDFSPNQNFWGSQKRFLPPPSTDVLQFGNLQEKIGSNNLQEKRLLGSQEEINKRFKRNDWSHFSMAGKGAGGKLANSEENSRENMGLAGRENMGLTGRENKGLTGIREIGEDVSGMGERWGARPGGIQSLMDIHVRPPQKDLSNSGKMAAFTEVSTGQKSDFDGKKFNKETVQYDKGGEKSGMDFVESIQKQVLVLAESHKKKMESIEKNNEAKEDKNKSKFDEKEGPSKRTRKDSKEDSNLFLYFYEGDAMLHDEDDDGSEALEESKDGEKSNLPLPVPCLSDTTKEPTEDDTSKKPVPISPIVNRRVVMEEAFGLGKCLANMKNDPNILKNDEPSVVSTNQSAPILPSPVPASRRSLHVDVDHEEETPKPAPMITPPPPMISQAKWRQNTETSNPPTRAEVYRHTLGLDNKHPIAALHELCAKKKWNVPEFKEMEEIVDGGTMWRFSALVNGKEFPSSKLFPKKKEAKSNAARICLQEMDIL